MRIADIRSIVREVGKEGFVQVLAECLQGRDQLGQQVPKKRPEDFSVRALYEGLVGPVEDHLSGVPGYNGGNRAFNYIELQEAVESTAFPSATGVLIAAKVIDAYNSVPTIGDRLVTNMPSKLRQERIVGFTSLEGPLEIQEGMPYEESGFQEKYVTTDTAKKGRILEITEEAIYFDQTGQLLMRAGRLGEMTAEEKELTILAGVLDVGSGAQGFKDVYRPLGTATALYQDGGNTGTVMPIYNYVSTVTALTDWTSINTALQYAADNIVDDRALAAERLPILFNAKVLLTARSLAATAQRIVRATTVRSGQISSDPSNQTETGNPVDGMAPGMVPLTSPFIDYLARRTGSRFADGKDWFIGDPQRQFVWQDIWPLQTLRSRQDDEASFRRDVVARFKVRYFGGIAAIDTKYFIKVNGA